MARMTDHRWPDNLMRPEQDSIAHLLRRFWQELATLPDLLQRDEQLLAAACTATLRQNVLEMMLALNGIAYPRDTLHLNTYLGQSQRAAIEKTLLAPGRSRRQLDRTGGCPGRDLPLVRSPTRRRL